MRQSRCLVTSMRKPIDVVVTETFSAPIDVAFDYAVPVDLTHIMRPRFPAPGVKRVEDQTGGWDGAGQSRRIYLTDGSSVFEELTGYDRPNGFDYRVSEFTGLFGRLVQEARGRWQFHKVSPGTCRVEWTYSFYPKNAVAAGILELLVKRVWRGVMTAALAQIAEDIAAGKHRTS